MKVLHAAAAWLLLVAPAAAVAAPNLALDADTTLAGVQSTRGVVEGDVFEVDLYVSGVTAASPLQSFQIELGIDGGGIAALDALEGSFLDAPVFTLEEVVTATSVRFTQLSADPTGASGEGVLARFRFQATAPGAASLSLPIALLSAPFGAPIAVGQIQGASIAVAPIPEPTGALLFALGLLAARWRIGRLARSS